MENKQFEEWLKANYKPFGVYNYVGKQSIIDISVVFHNIPFAMQWGVYLEFFDSVGIHVSIFVYSDAPLYRFDYDVRVITDSFIWGEETMNRFNTRQEAQQEAIKKAFEILEDGSTKR